VPVASTDDEGLEVDDGSDHTVLLLTEVHSVRDGDVDNGNEHTMASIQISDQAPPQEQQRKSVLQRLVIYFLESSHEPSLPPTLTTLPSTSKSHH
jgi:hypothetical protein